MQELVFKSEKGNSVTTSLLVAEKFERDHKNVIQSIENLLWSAEKSAETDYQGVRSMFALSHYEVDLNNGTDAKKRVPMYVMNRDGFTLLAMGFTGQKALKFKVEYINAFNKMEQTIKTGGFMVPTTFREALLLAAEQQEVIEAQQRQLSSQEPKVRFAEAVTGSDTNILVRDLAKMICQTGVNIGEGRLYDWMVEWKYLIRTKRWSNKKQSYDNDYTPTQKAADLKVFYLTESVITVGDRSFIKHTIKITPKGQEYFINKFLKQVAV